MRAMPLLLTSHPLSSSSSPPFLSSNILQHFISQFHTFLVMSQSFFFLNILRTLPHPFLSSLHQLLNQYLSVGPSVLCSSRRLRPQQHQFEIPAASFTLRSAKHVASGRPRQVRSYPRTDTVVVLGKVSSAYTC